MSFLNLGYHSIKPMRMKTLRLISLLCVLACPGFSHAQYILTLHCEQMDTYIWKTFKIRVTEIGTGDEVGRKTITVGSAAFSIDLYVLFQNKSYQVDFYADENGNGRYDAPPSDHAWRRTINNASGHTTINFTNDTNYTDIVFPDLPFGTYKAIWGGHWKNLTFGSTDSIEAAFNLRCDSVLASFSTKGVFGNPATVMFDFADTVSSDLDLVTDTIRFTPGAPWTGEVYIINSEIHGSLTSAGFELAFTGTLGLKQLMCLYTVSTGGTFLANGYFYLRELEVLSMTAPLNLVLTSTPVSCYNSFGSIYSEVVGGTGNYTYNWLPGGFTTPNLLEVSAGEYTLIVTDENGCTISSNYSLTEPQPLIILYLDVLNESCSGACDGSITIAVAGGSPPYDFSLEGAEGMCAGDYILYIYDANGCIISEDFTILSPEAIVFDTIIVTNATNGMFNGSIQVQVSGGNPPFIYSLNNSPFQVSNVFSGLPPDSFEVCIMDGYGCLVCNDSVVVQNITAVDKLSINLSWYPNPANSFLYVNSDIPLSAEIKDIRGQRIKFIPLILDQTIILEGIPAGMYILVLSDGLQTSYEKLIIH